MAEPKPLSGTSVNDLTKGNVLTTADLASVSALLANTPGTRQFDPWRISNEADQGTLYLGQQWDPQYAHLPRTRPAGSKSTTIHYLGNDIEVTIPDYGPNVHAEIHTSWHKRPTSAQLADARQGKNIPDMWLEVKNKKGDVVDRKDLSREDAGYIVGHFPDRKTDPGIDPETGKMRANLTFSIDPYEFGPEPFDLNHPAAIPKTDKKGKVSEELQGLYTIEKNNPALIRQYKTELFLAGMYGNNATLEDVDMSSITDADISAFGEIMMDASRYLSAGQKVTWQELLHARASDPSAKHRAQQSTPIIPLSDPVAITTAANEAGTRILGRAPTSQDLQTLVGFVHNAEHKYGAAQNAGGGQDVEQVDVKADIDQWMRQKYPNEAMAVDWGAAAQGWEQMLASTSPQPRLSGLEHG